jgi:hypothetical protein
MFVLKNDDASFWEDQKGKPQNYDKYWEFLQQRKSLGNVRTVWKAASDRKVWHHRT